MGASLTYYIWEGLLVGVAGSEFIQMYAGCGGGAGSTRKAFSDKANNPYMWAFKMKGAINARNHEHGGPIPPGKYRIAVPAQHPKLKLSARLTPEPGQPMYGRDGFLIHGPGPHGSDGCIVVEKKELVKLMDALKAAGGGTLFVEEAMDGARFA
jgi:hypothetical protein